MLPLSAYIFNNFVLSFNKVIKPDMGVLTDIGTIFSFVGI